MNHSPRPRFTFVYLWLLLLLLLPALPLRAQKDGRFNVRDFGASGRKADLAQPAIQKAIDAAAAAGGGTVYFPPGAYTTATLRLVSNLTLHLEAGAVVYASQDPELYKQHQGIGGGEGQAPVLFYAHKLQNLAFTGLGTVDGQARHVWEDLKEVDGFIKAETEGARAAGVEMKRAYALDPKVNLFFIVDCENVRVENLTITASPNWGLHVQWCKDVVIRGIRLFSSLTHGVNSDGIDIDGSRNVLISDCVIETGDDAICLKSTNKGGRFEPVENVTVTNCVLTSTSAGLKIGTESHGDFRHIVFSNCVVRNANRGVNIVVRDGATVENVLFSNLTLDTRRKHFNWWGDGDAIRFVVLQRTPASRVGTIRNVTVQNVIAHAQGTSLIEGFEGQPLQNITLSNVQVFMHPEEAPDKRATHAFDFRKVDGLTLREVTVHWDEQQPEPGWRSALHASQVRDLTVDQLRARQGLVGSGQPVLQLHEVRQALITRSRPQEGAGPLLKVTGAGSQGISLRHNDPAGAKVEVAKEVDRKAVVQQK
jgi:polygalacturonase